MIEQTLYNTVIVRQKAKSTYENVTWLKSNEDMQKDNLYGQLYDRVSKYYRDLINSNKAYISHCYLKGEDIKEGFDVDIDINKIKDNETYIYVGIYSEETGEQIL